MEINPRIPSVPKPTSIPLLEGEKPIGKSATDPLSMNYEDYNLTNTSKCSIPDLVHPSDLQELEKPDLSIQGLMLDTFTQSEELQKNQINYLYEKQAKLTQNLMREKKKIIELHKNSHATLSLWQPTIDLALPFCTSIIALYLGFSPDYSLSKIVAICTSIIGFAITGVKLTNIEIPNYIPRSYMAIFNLYMAYMNPTDSLTYITTFLQTLPVISEFVYNIDNNYMCSEEALAQKTIQAIERDLKNVAIEISRVMKIIGEKRKVFSITTDYTQLQHQIAAIGAV